MINERLPTTYSDEQSFPIELRSVPSAQLKNLLSLCVPVLWPVDQPVPQTLRIRDCSLKSKLPEVYNHSDLWNYREPDVITGVTKLRSVMAPYTSYVMLNPQFSVSFITLQYKVCDEEGMSYLEAHPEEKILNYIRNQWASNDRKIDPLDSFFTDWVTTEVYQTYKPWIKKLMLEAGIDEDEFDQIQSTRTHLLDIAFSKYPFLVHRFFQSHPKLNLLRHHVWPEIMEMSTQGVSIRLDPSRIAFADILGPLKEQTTLIF